MMSIQFSVTNWDLLRIYNQELNQGYLTLMLVFFSFFSFFYNTLEITTAYYVKKSIYKVKVLMFYRMDKIFLLLIL